MTDITELAQSLKAAANTTADAIDRLKAFPGDELIDLSQHEGEQVDIDIATLNQWYELSSPANIRALVEALGKAQQQTTESENRVRKQNRHICELFDDNTALRQRIAGLESRTVTVKLPDINEYLAEVHDKTLNRAFRLLAEGVRAGDVAAMRAAGIKVEVE
ncbi:TPA: hypothetical protein ACQZKC_005214 [Klebsiella pneumoniae]|nr:hypothetical protein [Klebsiella pneumoniae]MBC4907052.1 hypothetical protein [Klebsiella pneumoniae]MBC5243708.1 hypothetical protein [Klebsiella pneumoniae]MDS0155632.1 hypothetical protein [Klebsiella pneumoniae]HEN5101889.1 hypothetical protein [Klebsiella pneumoniae]